MATQTASNRKPRPPTVKQQRFLDKLPFAASATDAAQAVYDVGDDRNMAAVIASQNLRKPVIQAALQAQAKTAAEAAGLSQLWVLETLKTNTNRAMQAEPVVDTKGHPTGEYQYEGAVANQALGLIGKHLRMFDDAPKPSGPTIDNRTQILMAYSPEQLRALLAAMKKDDEKAP